MQGLKPKNKKAFSISRSFTNIGELMTNTAIDNRTVLTYSQTSQEVRVTVLPEYVEGGQSPVGRGFAFSYHVTIENFKDHQITLVDRHWLIFSGGVLFDEVRGAGVVGLKPVIMPGESFQYSSWAVINDPVGHMSGSYGIVLASGAVSRIEIPEFHLLVPNSLH